VCGKRNPKGRPFISNGVEAKVGEFPWHVGIYRYSANGTLQQVCGGSLIHPSMVLTGMLVIITHLNPKYFIWCGDNGSNNIFKLQKKVLQIFIGVSNHTSCR
jgi:hypothetical protein